jgi:hypothetical protein
MSKPEKSLVKKALEYFYSFADAHNDVFVFHDYRFVCETATLAKEIAKGEDLSKDEYEPGIVAIILSDLGTTNAKDPSIDNAYLINDFFETNNVPEKERESILYFVEFLKINKTPLNVVEKVVRDGKDIHLGLPDALERLSLLQTEVEKLTGKTHLELEWLEKCKQYFITHSFDTRYANREYGAARSKNYIELEKRIDKLRTESIKEKRNNEKALGGSSLSSENEDLFKIAFRNYINLIAIADSKAGLLIQVNSILASVVVALVIKKLEETPMLALPTAALLIGSAITIFYSILASKPLERKADIDLGPRKEEFFFGSFDRLDPTFKAVPWGKYSGDMLDFFGGDKRVVFDELIKESFEVRKVLSKKFGYLSIAYKVFFSGLVLAIIGFIIVMVHEYNVVEATQAANPFG